ncbi:hypothetical protein DD238_008524 [Peronospora effusa]|uniref:Uncharacterized protein n=1 Tax=Peronospora effusa TaxID=542832 RepID=A0A3M6V7D8_9STRA|nr:hypothetical protein DD238_008524 [Peronospora effusa]
MILKIDDGVTMTQHLAKFDELMVGLHSLDESIDEAWQLVSLLSSLPAEYEIIAPIVEKDKDVTIIEMKEKLLEEYERKKTKEATERALKATTHRVKSKFARFDKGGRNNGRKENVSRKRSGFKGKYYNCDKFGHMSGTAHTLRSLAKMRGRYLCCWGESIIRVADRQWCDGTKDAAPRRLVRLQEPRDKD